jgi:hypothetical protein
MGAVKAYYQELLEAEDWEALGEEGPEMVEFERYHAEKRERKARGIPMPVPDKLKRKGQES